MAETHNGDPDGASKPIEQRLRIMIDQIPALVWSKLPDGSLDFFNQRFREYTGLSLEEGLGWGWINAFHPDDRRMEDWRAALAAGEPFEKEARLRGTDSKYRWFALRAVPVKNDQGVIIKWYGTSTDIDDRKQAEPSPGVHFPCSIQAHHERCVIRVRFLALSILRNGFVSVGRFCAAQAPVTKTARNRALPSIIRA